MISPLLKEEFCDEDVPAQPSDSVRELPGRPWVELSVLLWDFLSDVINERLVDLFDVAVICTPRIDGEAVFASEEIIEEDPVWCLWGGVNHALESDILV